MIRPSYKTVLKERDLWFDGESTFHTKDLARLLRNYDIKYVDEITPIVEEYNRLVPVAQRLSIKTKCDKIEIVWQLPNEYANIDVEQYVRQKFLLVTQNMFTEDNLEEWIKRADRLVSELVIFREKGLFDVLRVIIYIINTLTETNSVWGVGRGSSVSSYVLYILGVHDVDSVKYELDINDFLHD